MKIYFKILFLVSTFFSTKLFCQVDTTAKSNDSLVVIKDSRLDILTQKQIVFSKRAKLLTSNGLYHGYRLQLLNSNNRTQAFKLKYELMQAYPTQKAYVSFQAPYFKVRFGNFLKRADAETMKNSLIKKYPNGVFVVEDTIEYFPKDDEDVKQN